MQDFEVKERLREHLEYLCSFDKLSGEPEAYRAVEYILEVLEKSGISCHEEDFPAYLSNPVSSVLIADGARRDRKCSRWLHEDFCRRRHPFRCGCV